MLLLVTSVNNSFNDSLEEYFTPTVLWENPDTGVAQSATTLTLSDDISNYKYIEYHYILWIVPDAKKGQYQISGKIPSDSCHTVLATVHPNGVFFREVNTDTAFNGNSIKIGSGKILNGAQEDRGIILVKILGWKH